MTTRTARGRGQCWIGISVEAAIAPQADEHRHGALVEATKVEGQLKRIIACVKHEKRDGVGAALLRQLVGLLPHEAADLLSSQGIDILPGHQTLDLDGCRPPVTGEAELRYPDPLIRPPCHNRLAGRVARGMVVEATRGTSFGIAASPDAQSYRIDRFVLREQRMRGNEA